VRKIVKNKMDVEKKKMMQEENAKPNQYMDNYKVE